MPNELAYSKVLIIGGTVVLFLLVSFSVLIMVLYQKRYYRYIHERQALQSKFSQTLLQAQLEIQEQTLKNISEEIHDNIGQVLSLTKLNLGTMDIQQPRQLMDKIDDSKKLVSKAIQDLRDLSRSLNTDYIQQRGLHKSIEYELELIRKAGKHQTRFESQGNIYRMDTHHELILFRIIQEVLNNVIKHANASTITVSVVYHPQLYMLTIMDDGEGFDLRPLEQSANPNFGMGIKNMHNRAKLIGAEYNISSTPLKGTTVQILLPQNVNTAEHASNE